MTHQTSLQYSGIMRSMMGFEVRIMWLSSAGGGLGEVQAKGGGWV